MSGRLNANPYQRQEGIAFTAPGRTFDWTYPPDRAGRRRAAFGNITTRLQGALGGGLTRQQRLVSAAQRAADRNLRGRAHAPEEAQDDDEEGDGLGGEHF